MHAGMNSIARRTRSKWDIHYRNLHNELRRKRGEECVGNDSRDYGSKTGENRGGVGDNQGSFSGNPENDENSRTGERIYEGSSSWNFGKRAKRMGSRGKGKLDKMYKNDSVDDDPIVSEKVVSNVSCSNSGSVPNEGSVACKNCGVTNVEEVVVPSTPVEVNDGSSSGVQGRGRPLIRPLTEGLNVSPEASGDLGNSVVFDDSDDSMNSEGPNVDYSDDSGSSKSKPSIVNDDDDDDDASDEDYNVHGISSSDDDSLKVGHCNDTVKASKGKKYETVTGGLKKRKSSGSQILGDCNICDKEQKGIAKRLRSRSISSPQKKNLELEKLSRPIPVSEGEESYSSSDLESKSSTKKDGCNTEHVQKASQRGTRKIGKPPKKKSRAARDVDSMKMLVHIIEKEVDGCTEQTHPFDNNLKSLPLKFRFDEEETSPPEKSEWQKEIDSLFCDLDMGLRESMPGCENLSTICNDDDNDFIPQDIDSTPESCCRQGKHYPFLDEQIGIKCTYCSAVLLEIEDILPPFYTPTPGRYEKKDFWKSDSCAFDEIQFLDSTCGKPYLSSIHAAGTVWDLIPNTKNGLYPHQQEGFEFMWRNIAGDIFIDKLERPLSGDGKGCIISHAPGTGKTRLSIVFIQAFMKLYPTCRPVIVAPCGMLLTWEDEFKKWGVNIPFHNLNSMELSAEENEISEKIIGKVGCNERSRNYVRLLKLYSWVKGRSILGVSYTLFEKLAGDRGKGQHDQIKKLLLKSPGLLVLDEGHTPRNDQSLLWKALMNVSTNRRIILSGTPFQNNFEELYNTLYLVNPKFSDYGIHQSCKKGRPRKNGACGKWTTLTKSIRTTTDYGLRKLRKMIHPFVHVHKGTILQESLPGMRDSLVFLRPTELQKSLLEVAAKERNFFHMVRMVSLISVHPSLVAEEKMFSAQKMKLKRIESKIDAGVKINFVAKLIWLAGSHCERVLVFSQFIDNLVFIKQRLESAFSWKEGREVLYMDGKLEQNQRQSSINSFNDDSSEAKVLLASEKACSEGINLVGASRVILLDSVWNPSVERQAISRAYRLGQKKAVYVYHLITSETMELKKYASQAQKDRISQLIFCPTDGMTCSSETAKIITEDKLFDQLIHDRSSNHCFEKIIHQPKASDLIDTFGFVDLEQ